MQGAGPGLDRYVGAALAWAVAFRAPALSRYEGGWHAEPGVRCALCNSRWDLVMRVHGVYACRDMHECRVNVQRAVDEAKRKLMHHQRKQAGPWQAKM